MMAALVGGAVGAYTPGTMGTVTGYWYWRKSTTRADANGDACVEVVHTIMTERVVVCTHGKPGRAAKVANSLNRLYGSPNAPRFDEETGAVIP